HQLMRSVSIVVPTRDRGDTLAHTIRTLVEQEYEALEIIVSDNASSDDTHDVVKSFSDSRLKYVNTGTRLSMSDNWEFALEQATGEFLGFIGDDDGYLPNAISAAMAALDSHGLDAIVWDKADYCWPDHIDPALQNWIVVKDRSRGLEVARGQKKLRRVLEFHESYSRLPCLYSGILRRSFVSSVMKASTNHRFFNGLSPDVYSGVALSMVVESYLSSATPFSVNGASRHSNGTSVMRSKTNDADSPAARFASENNLVYDERIKLAPSTLVFVIGEYLEARKSLPSFRFPAPDWNRYVRALVKDAAASYGRAEILDSAAHTATLTGVSVAIHNAPPPPQRPPATGLEPQGNSLAFKAPLDMVSNVYDACKLVGSIVASVQQADPRAPFERFIQRAADSLLFEAKNLYRSI
ncbi:MAG: glycosyltransferase family 2 protein, partial [Gemmatimonadaceae bacterium]